MPESSSDEQKVVVGMPVTNEVDKIPMETKYVRRTHTKMQHIIQWTLHVFQDATLDYRIVAIAEAEGVSLLETKTYKSSRGKKNFCFLVVENFIRLVVTQGAVKEAIRMKVDDLAESRDGFQLLRQSSSNICHSQFPSTIP